MLGYSKAQTFMKIVLPQVIKRILPAMGNEIITLVKDTSLAFVLGIMEMFSAAKALAALVPDDELSADFIIPDPFDPRAADAVAEAVRACAGAEKRG